MDCIKVGNILEVCKGDTVEITLPNGKTVYGEVEDLSSTHILVYTPPLGATPSRTLVNTQYVASIKLAKCSDIKPGRCK